MIDQRCAFSTFHEKKHPIQQVFWLWRHHSRSLPAAFIPQWLVSRQNQNGFARFVALARPLQRRARAGFSPDFPFHHVYTRHCTGLYIFFNLCSIYNDAKTLSSHFTRSIRSRIYICHGRFSSSHCCWSAQLLLKEIILSLRNKEIQLKRINANAQYPSFNELAIMFRTVFSLLRISRLNRSPFKTVSLSLRKFTLT